MAAHERHGSSAQLLLLAAALDNIGPAALIQLGGKDGPQYLINVPEGLARMSMEHKVRPGPQLRAILSTSEPTSDLAGLPGLLLRLKQDGHRAISIIGCKGTNLMVTGMQNIISWQHPFIKLQEIEKLAPLQPAYQDDALEVNSLCGNPKIWIPPTWLMQSQGGGLDDPSAALNTPSDSLLGESNEQASSESGETSTSSSECSDTSEEFPTAGASPQLDHASNRFAALDAAFTYQAGRNRALAVLAAASQKTSHEGPDFCEKGAVTASTSVAAHGSASTNSQVVPARPGYNSRERNCQGAKRAASHNGQNSAKLGFHWGYLMNIRRARQAILIVAFKDSASFAHAKDHPVFSHLEQTKVVLVLHLTNPNLAGTAHYRAWSNSLPGTQVNQSAADNHIGYLASVRLSMRLNHIAPNIFPLPEALIHAGAHTSDGEDNFVTWHNLRRVLISPENTVTVNDEQTAAAPKQDEIVSDMLNQHPGLEESLSAFQRQMLNPPLSPRVLPEVEPMTRFPCSNLQQETTDTHRSAKRHKACHTPTIATDPTNAIPAALDRNDNEPHMPAGGAWSQRYRPALQSARGNTAFHGARIPQSGLQHYWQATDQPGHSNQAAAHHVGYPIEQRSAQVPMWTQFTVTDGGQVLGQAQLTPAGWVGHPDAVRKLNWPADVSRPHTGWSNPLSNILSPARPPASGPQATTQRPALAAQQNSIIQGDTSEASWRPQAGPSTAHVAPEAKDSQLWNKEDIELGDLAETENSSADSAGADDREGADTSGTVNAALQHRDQEASKEQSSLSEHQPHQGARHQQLLEDLASRGDRTSVRFLGTGCAEPSKYRASSGILIQLDSGRSILLDTGEGTYGQLVRYFGHESALRQIDSLAAIFISHRHADHCTGLPGILQARSTRLPPLLVVGPKAVHSWLQQSFAQLSTRYCYQECTSFLNPSPQITSWLKDNLGLTCFTPFCVRHCSDAWGVKLAHQSGWSVCYSGDTRPCKALVDAARDCTLLIHEATYSAELAEMAFAKKHSTNKEACSVASQAQVGYCVLTHFSQRYAKLPWQPLGEELIAFDGMQFRLIDLTHLKSVLGIIDQALAQKEEIAVLGQETCSPPEGCAEVGIEEPQKRLPTHIRFED